MAQIANRDDTARAADARKEAGDTNVELAREMGGRNAEAVKDAARRAGEIGRRTVDGAAQAAQDMADAEQDAARLWFDAAGEQLRHNIETFQRLAAVRDWREAVEIQGTYVRESMSRLAHLLSAQLEAFGSVTSRLVAAGREQARPTR